MLAVVLPALSSVSKRLQRWAVLTPLFFLPSERKIRLERWIRGREQAEKLRRADVTVVSFGKSGRTWLRVMLSRAFQVKHGLSDRLLIGFDNFHLRNRAIPKIFFTHDNYLKDYTGPRRHQGGLCLHQGDPAGPRSGRRRGLPVPSVAVPDAAAQEGDQRLSGAWPGGLDLRFRGRTTRPASPRSSTS